MHAEDGTEIQPDTSEYKPDVTYIAIGWLGRGPFTRGSAPPSFVDALVRVAFSRRANQMRGYHYCEFCSAEDLEIRLQEKRIVLGSAEIWIPAGVGRVYAAPNLIIHYVRDHEYRPPQEFIDAVMKHAGTEG